MFIDGFYSGVLWGFYKGSFGFFSTLRLCMEHCGASINLKTACVVILYRRRSGAVVFPEGPSTLPLWK